MQSGIILLFEVILLSSPWLKENSEISLPETVQNGLILLFYIKFLVEKNHNVTNLTALCLNHTFTMVEENFEIVIS